jgi:hypothetical protein
MWQLASDLARFTAKHCTAELNLAQPGAGLYHLTHNDAVLPLFHLLGIAAHGIAHDDTEEVPADRYVRDTDLIATYPQTAARPFGVQVYWRALEHADPAVLCGWELILSTQTDLLDSQPRLVVRSELAATEVLRLTTENSDSVVVTQDSSFCPQDGAGVFVFRIAGHQLSYIEMIHPVDFSQAEITGSGSSGPTSIITHLFFEHLEKGVIRRGRLRGYLVSRTGDCQSAAHLFSEFCRSAIPLTT